MDGVTILAEMLKERENPELMGIQTGKVINTFPDIKIKLGEKIILDKSNLIISDTAYNKGLSKNTEVILIPTNTEQKFYLMDKVVKI